MTLYDLKNVIDFTFDLEDDEVCGRFYIELDEINEDYAAQIDVVKIGSDYVICKLSRFLQRLANFHPNLITDYLNENYYDGKQKDWLAKQLTKNPCRRDPEFRGDVTDDGGEAVYHFITNDMYDFLTQKQEGETKMEKYYTADKATGAFIEEFDSYQEAKAAILAYEEEDKKDGTYKEGFYDIVDEWHCSIIRAYFIVDELKNGDTFDEKYYFDVDHALKEAEFEWNHLTEYDQNRRKAFYVAEATIDDDDCIDYNAYMRIVKTFK